MDRLDFEAPYEEPRYRQVCPAVVVSVEERGAAVARALRHLVAEQWDDLCLVRSVRLEAGQNGSEHAERILAAIRSLHQLELVQAVRRRGWTLRHRDGLTIFVLIPALDAERQRGLQSTLAALDAHLTRPNSGTPALTGIFLAREEAGSTSLPTSAGPEPDAILGPADFTGGCYRVAASNTYGLTFADPQRWITMIAQWMFELLTTPLGPALAALPCPSAQSWSSFGLARWRLPTAKLLAALTQRWQIALLDASLAPSANRDAGETLTHLFVPLPHWQTARPHSPFAARPGAWAWLGLPQVATLRLRMDSVFEAAVAALEQEAGTQEKRLDHLLAETETALQAAIAALLDAPAPARLTTARQRLKTAQRTTEQELAAAQQRTLELESRLENVEQELERKAQALDAAQAQFPPWTLRAWLGVLLCPWRWLRLAVRYLHIRKATRAYLSTLEHLWLLRRRAQETGWQVAYGRRICETLAEIQAQVAAFQHALGELRAQMTAAPPDRTALLTQLEAAALPARTFEQLYQRGYAPPQTALAALLGTAPTLSDLVEMRDGAHYLLMTIGEQARERFDFVHHLRLDQLLVRSHGAAELRRRLAELLEAAGPFCTCDRTHLSPEKRAEVLHTIWLDLPGGATSPLADLVETEPRYVYAGRSPGTITAVQVITGLPDTETVRAEIDERLADVSPEEVSHE